MAYMVKTLSAMQETWVWSLGQKDPLEKGMATHSSMFVWRIPWAEDPGRLQSMGFQRVRHNWATNTHTHTHTHTKPNPLCTQSKGLRTRRANGVSSRPRQENINVPSQAGKVPPCSCMSAQSLQLCLTPCNPMNCSPPGSSVHGILQARILEWVAIPSSKRSSQPRDWTHVSCIACEFFNPEPSGKPSPLLRLYVLVKPSTHCNLLYSVYSFRG